MNETTGAASLFVGWLADYYLAATLLLALSWIAWRWVRQPVHRIAVAWSVMLELILLAAVCATPFWPRIPLRSEVVDKTVLETAPAMDADWTPKSPVAFPNNFADHSVPEHPEPLVAKDALQQEAVQPAAAQISPPRRWTWAEQIAAGFIFGAMAVLLRLGWGALAAARIFYRAAPAGEMLLAELAQVVRDTDPSPRLLVSSHVGNAVALGLFRPTIVLPAALAEAGDCPDFCVSKNGTVPLAGSPAMLRAVLEHEMAHVRNRDLWLLASGRWLSILLFAHPLFWWLRRAIRVDQELRADAVAAGDNRQDYAEELLRLVRMTANNSPKAVSAAVGIWEGPSSFSRRIAMLLDETFRVHPTGSRRWKFRAFGLLMVFGAACSVLTLQPNHSTGQQNQTASPAKAESSKNVEKTQSQGAIVADKKQGDFGKSPQTNPPTPPKKSEPVLVNGQVVDDETGQPVKQFTLQGGFVDPKDPTKTAWGYSETPSGSPFQERIDWAGGWRARIVAAGYLPQPILDKAPADGATRIDNCVVRLKRGRTIAGRVVYHDGSPAAKAAVFLVGDLSTRIRGGIALRGAVGMETEDTAITKTIADADGRFTLTGGGGEAKTIAVSTPRLDLWTTPAPEEVAANNSEFTIKLPEPGRLLVKYDIPGGDAEAKLLLQLLQMGTGGAPTSRGAGYLREPLVANKGQVSLDNLPPGKYTLVRRKAYFCDRRDVVIEPGKTTTSEFVRDRGTVVEGQIVGLKEGMFAHPQMIGPNGEMPASSGAIISVRPVSVMSDFAGPDWKLPVFDAFTCGPDGKFKTERLSPGQYALIAEAYLPEPYSLYYSTGRRRPSFVGRTVVTVPESGEPPKVTIKLQERKK